MMAHDTLSKNLKDVFLRLRAILSPHAHLLLVKTDTTSDYYLDTHEVRARDGYRTGFGGVKIGKRYVSFHLMPVYVHPELLEPVSEDLRRRMQGKSCFNFTRVDPVLFAELADLTEAGLTRFAADKRLQEPVD